MNESRHPLATAIMEDRYDPFRNGALLPYVDMYYSGGVEDAIEHRCQEAMREVADAEHQRIRDMIDAPAMDCSTPEHTRIVEETYTKLVKQEMEAYGISRLDLDLLGISSDVIDPTKLNIKALEDAISTYHNKARDLISSFEIFIANSVDPVLSTEQEMFICFSLDLDINDIDLRRIDTETLSEKLDRKIEHLKGAVTLFKKLGDEDSIDTMFNILSLGVPHTHKALWDVLHKIDYQKKERVERNETVVLKDNAKCIMGIDIKGFSGKTLNRPPAKAGGIHYG